MFRKPIPDLGPAPEHFPPEFKQTWLEVASSFPRGHLAINNRFQVEMASLLLQDLRATGPEWPAEKYAILRGLLNDMKG